MVKKAFSLLIKITLSALLVVLLIKVTKLDPIKTLHELKHTDPWWLLAATVLYVGTICTNSYRWLILARMLGYKLSYLESLKLYFESAFANNFMPSNFGGDALRAYNLHSVSQGSWLRAASTVLVERFVGFGMMFIMIPFGMFFMNHSNYANVMPKEVSAGLWLSFIATVLGIGSYKIWSNIPLGIFQKLKYAVGEYTKCHKSLSIVVLWTFITHMLLLFGNICTAYAVGINMEQLPFWFWLLLTPASTMAGFMIPAVKGVGAKEASYVYFMGFLGINSDTGLAIGFISFIAATLCSLPGITIAFKKVEINKIVEEEQQHEAEELAHQQ